MYPRYLESIFLRKYPQLFKLEPNESNMDSYFKHIGGQLQRYERNEIKHLSSLAFSFFSCWAGVPGSGLGYYLPISYLVFYQIVPLVFYNGQDGRDDAVDTRIKHPLLSVLYQQIEDSTNYQVAGVLVRDTLQNVKEANDAYESWFGLLSSSLSLYLVSSSVMAYGMFLLGGNTSTDSLQRELFSRESLVFFSGAFVSAWCAHQLRALSVVCYQQVSHFIFQ
jgi:hypothetical protein